MIMWGIPIRSKLCQSQLLCLAFFVPPESKTLGNENKKYSHLSKIRPHPPI